MQHVLATLEPLDPATGERVTLRAASADLRELTGMGDAIWWPAITELPTRSIALFDGDFSGAPSLGTASVTLQVDRLAKLYGDARKLFWPSAKVKLYRGATGDAWPWAVWFPGVVDKWDITGNRLRLTLRIDTAAFDADVLTSSYAGTGGAEGGESLKGTLKPLIFGRARNVEPILVDEVNSVFQFSGYGPIRAVNALFERASSFGQPVEDHPDYEALIAATIPRGRWATCLNQGLIRLGAPPAGLITGDVDGHRVGAGWPRLTGAVIAAAADIAGVDPVMIDVGSLEALDAIVARNINIVLTDQTTVIELAQRLARPCNAQAAIGWDGRLFVARPSFGTPIATLDAQGRQLPKVLKNVEADVSAPYCRIAMGADRCWRVHSLDEISSPYTLVLTGPYDPTRKYRQGNIVDYEGSRWEWINESALAGHAPMEGEYWTELPESLSGVLIVYPDGTPLPVLQPDEPNADNTGNQFESVFTDKLGRQPLDVVGDLDISLESVAAAIMRGGLFKDILDRETTLADGTRVKTWAQTIGVSIGDTVAFVTDLREVSSDGVVKALLSLNSNGHVTGWTATNDGERGSFYIVADEWGFVDPADVDNPDAVPTKPFYYFDGVLYADNMRVRMLAADTVQTANLVGGAVGKSETAKTGIQYDGSGPAPGAVWQTVINYNLQLPARANVTFTISGRHAYVEAAGDFEGLLLLNGADVDVKAFGGAGVYVPTWSDVDTFELPKGSHNVQLRWRGSYGIHLQKGRVVMNVNYIGGSE